MVLELVKDTLDELKDALMEDVRAMANTFPNAAIEVGITI